ncbi:hypothetical protein VTN31DRAFT_4352 [Thermomyces dupontii]|uniref:uncharacterized protein n=1 Tax=Talaromyces thermophilus TaxID=28565 RepID=UPI003742C338
MRAPIFLFLAAVATATSPNWHPNIVDHNERGPLLGSFFGTPGINATFDYVVVGGGTAGLTIAARLAERNATVAVVEAGGFYETDNNVFSIVPGYCSYYTGSAEDDFQPLIDWGITTVPQINVLDRMFHYARGKTLGGSSARNYMLYQRPTVGSLQQWASQVCDRTYTWDDFLPFFKRSVNYTHLDPSLYTNSSNTQDASAFSPSGGPIHVSFGNYVDPFGTWAQKAFIAAGMTQIDGLNSGYLLGSAYATLTINPANAHRSSSESGFLQHAIENGLPLTVYKNSLALRILFQSKKATGVLVESSGTFGTPSVKFVLSAKKEVIVSAGTFQSPQLLMVSGIGPCDHLAEFGIECLENLLGVGQNMEDHVLFGTTHRVNVRTASARANNATLAAELFQLYLINATGPLSILGPGVYGWEKLPIPYRSRLSERSLNILADYPEDWPEIEWLPVAAYNGYNRNKQTEDPRDGHNYATLNTALIAQRSKGTVRLQSANMTTLPLVDPNWLSDPTDVEMAIEAFKRQREIWKIFVDLGVADPEEAFPGSNYSTDAEILHVIKQTIASVYHASGTCKMGCKGDKTAVVDNRGHVFGTQNLRVVDASIFPFLPPGHPQSIVYALAEKIAIDIIEGR